MRRHIAFALVLSYPAIAAAQVDTASLDRRLEQVRRETRLLVDPNISIGQRTYVDYGAFTTLSFLSLDDSQLHNHVLREFDLTIYARGSVDGVHDFFFRGRSFYNDFHRGDQFSENSTGWDGRIERATYAFDLARYLSAYRGRENAGGSATVQIGRDLVLWGNGLTLSQELDAVLVGVSSADFDLQLIAGVTPLDSVDFDTSRPRFDERTKRVFIGGITTLSVGTHRPFIYALVQRDNNDAPSITTQLNGEEYITEFDYNSNYFGIGSRGVLSDRVVYGIEAVYETGNTLSNSRTVGGDLDDDGDVDLVRQERDQIEAWALDLQLDYLPGDERRTRIGAEFILASGDTDRLLTSTTLTGNRPGTPDHAFNAFGLLNTGIAFAPSVSNVAIARLGASFFPLSDSLRFGRMQVGIDAFAFAKLQAKAPIDEPTSDQSLLGFEPDLYLNWQVTSDVTIALRYGIFFPGPAIEADESVRQFLFASFTFSL